MVGKGPCQTKEASCIMNCPQRARMKSDESGGGLWLMGRVDGLCPIEKEKPSDGQQVDLIRVVAVGAGLFCLLVLANEQWSAAAFPALFLMAVGLGEIACRVARSLSERPRDVPLVFRKLDCSGAPDDLIRWYNAGASSAVVFALLYVVYLYPYHGESTGTGTLGAPVGFFATLALGGLAIRYALFSQSLRTFRATKKIKVNASDVAGLRRAG